MAESQVQYNYEDNAEDIVLNLSEERFKPYLIKAGHNKDYAFNLYLYNARLSKAFLFPLHILEISLRNAINNIFKSEYHNNWPQDGNFRSILTIESRRSLDKAIQRAKSYNIDDIVSEISFDFWSNLFRNDYDRNLWQTHMSLLFANKKITRNEFQKIIKDINHFRNRIAHHEPIHNLDISKMHTTILDVLSWINIETHLWVKHFSTVNTTIRTSPSASGESKPHFIDRCDRNFSVVSYEQKLSDFPTGRFVLCQSKLGEIVLVIEKQDIFDFLMSKVDEDDYSLVVDLSEFTCDNVIDYLNKEQNYQICSGTESLSKAKAIFRERGVAYIIIRNPEKIIGVLAKAHRQY